MSAISRRTMSMPLVRIALVLLLQTAGLITAASAETLQQKVDSAIGDQRQGNAGKLSGILDPAAVAPLATHLDGADEDLRRAVMIQLAEIATLPACQAIVPLLADEVGDIRDRAARHVHDCRERFESGKLHLNDYPRKAVELGTSAAQAYLLLGEDRSRGNLEFLRSLAEQDGEAIVKLSSSSAPVSPALPAAVALGRPGEASDAAPLRRLAASVDVKTTLFLLRILSQVSDPSALRALTESFDNLAEISDGVPSGAQPRRRVADLAVDAFVTRFGLQPPFEINTAGRYSDEQRDWAKKAALSAI